MKKYLIAALAMAFGSTAYAQTQATKVCDGKDATTVEVLGGKGKKVQNPTFIRTGFDFNCSNNVFLVYNERSATLLTVGAASAKGNEYFGGHSDGGAVSSKGKCSEDPCVEGDATTGDNKAYEEATSGS